MTSCGTKERRILLDAMDEYNEHFTWEHHRLSEEYSRLKELLHDVIWYNFETVARTWHSPWPESIGDSRLELHAHRYYRIRNRSGRWSEKSEHPFYYEGSVDNAPPLPPAIIFEELKLVRKALEVVEASCAAPYEWAPGGRLYEQMLRESDGVAAYDQLSSKVEKKRKHDRDKCCGLCLGDPMERQVET